MIKLGEAVRPLPLGTLLALGRRQGRAELVGGRRRGWSTWTGNSRFASRVSIDTAGTVRSAPDTVASACRALANLCAKQVVLLLELLEPACCQHLLYALWTSAVVGEEKRLLRNHLVVQWISLALVFQRPVDQRLLNIRDSAFGALDGRSISVFMVEIFIFLT